MTPTFSEFLLNEAVLLEKLITLGNKAYPKSGNIVILAGGAGSGKGTIVKSLLGIDAKALDVDELKLQAIKSTNLSAEILRKTGVDVKKLNLRNSDDVGTLHRVIDEIGLVGRREQALFKSIEAANTGNLPNLIFDVTLKNDKKLKHISDNALRLGYDPKNIHIVWVVTAIDVAVENNQNRSRVVPSEILMDTHIGAAATMQSITSDFSKYAKYMNGDIWFVFNNPIIDTHIVFGDALGDKSMFKNKKKQKPSFIKSTEMVKVKAAGSSVMSAEKMGKEIMDKIERYVPV